MPSDDASPSTLTSQNDHFKPAKHGLRTIHDYLQIVDETIDRLESVGCSHPGFFMSESVQPL
jgi:hypothetical protein